MNASLVPTSLIEIKEFFKSCSWPAESTGPEGLLPGLEPGSNPRPWRKAQDLRTGNMYL